MFIVIRDIRTQKEKARREVPAGRDAFEFFQEIVQDKELCVPDETEAIFEPSINGEDNNREV